MRTWTPTQGKSLLLCLVALWLAAPLAACGGGAGGDTGRPGTVTPGDTGEDRPQAGTFLVMEEQIKAQRQEQALQVTVPVQAQQGDVALKGALVLEDLEGNELARAEVDQQIAQDQTQDLLVALPLGDQLDLANGQSMNYTLRYQLREGSDAPAVGWRSLFQVLRQDQVYLLSSDTVFAGSESMVRLIAQDPGSGQVLSGRNAVVTLIGENGFAREVSGVTDEVGTLAIPVAIPEELSGSVDLEAAIEGRNGDMVMQATLQVRRESRVLLTTDKPFYQPGQTVHLRSLAMRRPALVPEADEQVIYEIQDPKGNKVYRETSLTDDFGVASNTFKLANEVNLGTWRILATVGDTTTERAITVDRYALPKFRVEFEADRGFYRPGDQATGTVRAGYFFGRPVSGGQVTLQAWKFDLEFEQFAEVNGQLDADGNWDFALDLPDFFVGQPLEQGNAFVRLDISVTDGAGHTQTLTRSLAVARDALLVQAIPAADVVPGVPLDLFVLLAEPSGSPTTGSGDVLVNGEAIPFEADARGVARVTLPAPSGRQVNLTVEIHGEEISKAFTLGTAAEHDHALAVRSDKALYRAGDSAQLSIQATPAIGRVFIDVLRDNQIVGSLARDVEEGQASVSLDLAEDLVGNLQFEVYAVTPEGNIIRSHALVFVERADDLKLSVLPGADSYQPGETARLDITVTDSEGDGVVSSVGLMVVDEAVFAIQDFRPGMEKVYFQLEQEILQPRYQINGYSAEGVLRDQDDQAPEERDELAHLVFAASRGMSAYGVFVDSWQRDQGTAAQLANTRQRQDGERIYQALQAQFEGRQGQLSDQDIQAWADEQDGGWFDPWGSGYTITGGYQLIVSGPGPDEKPDTMDDFQASWNLDELFGWQNDGFANNGDFDGVPEADAGAGGGDPSPPSEEDGGGEGPRVRSYFPETLYVNPGIITDANGQASVEVPLADSITTWRVTGMASSQTGGLGSALGGVRVFQEFFVDINFPATLTQADEVTVPVALYNYLETPQTVTLRVDEPSEDPWYELLDGGERQVELQAGEVTSQRFRVRVTRPGWHDFQVTALGEVLSDAVRRRVQVIPDGQEQVIDYSDRLDGDVTREVVFPPEAIEGALSLQVKIYPGFFSQAVEGLDSLLRLPSGCFEQTSSTTYPNVLVLKYMRDTEQVNPEIELKALEYINLGYQRLLTFEVDGGGFEWFGNDPAHRILTGYGLLEFADMAKVAYVDPAIIARTQRWLLDQREADGRWRAAPEGIHEGATNNFTDSDLRATAYLIYALGESGYEGSDLDASLQWLRQQDLSAIDDPYSIALVANALLSVNPGDPTGVQLASRLDAMKQMDQEAGTIWWESSSTSFTYGTGSAMNIETSAYALHALLRAGGYNDTLEKGTTWLIQQKDSFGNWSNTQATILTLRFMLDTLGNGQQEADATVRVHYGDQQVQELSINTANSDILRQVDLNSFVQPGANPVRLEFTGTGTFMYQVTGRYYVPWEQAPLEPQGPLSIQVSYDKTQLETDETVTATVDITNNASARAEMVLVDLGVPPGFDVLRDDFQVYIDQGLISRVDTTGRQILVYLYGIDAGQTTRFSYRMQAGEPLRAQSPPSVAYLYYEPGMRAESAPEMFEVEEGQ